MIYGLDPDYDKNLEENKFLKEFNFVDDSLRFINDDGHLVDMEGRLINEDGRFVAYRTEEGKGKQDPEQLYFVDREGEEVVLIDSDDGEEEWVKISLKDRKPFLDDKNKPIEAPVKAETSDEEPAKEDASSEKPVTAKKRKTTKTTN